MGGSGEWLIDPDFINIVDNTLGALPPVAPDIFFTPVTAGTTNIDPRAITRALNGGNLTLSANLDITVSSVINPVVSDGTTSFPSANTLTLQAGRSLVINEEVDLNSSLILRANDGDADATTRTGTGLGVVSVNAPLTSQNGNITIILEQFSGLPTQFRPGDITISAPLEASPGGTVSITAESVTPATLTAPATGGNIILASNIRASGGANNRLNAVNLTTGVSGSLIDGGFINQTGGIITASSINALTQSSAPAVLGQTAPGEHGIDYQLDSYIYLGSANEADNVSLLALGAGGLATYVPGAPRPLAAPTRFARPFPNSIWSMVFFRPTEERVRFEMELASPMQGWRWC